LLKSKNMFSTESSTESASIDDEEAKTQDFDETEWKD
jgi:hypothetical protein